MHVMTGNPRPAARSPLFHARHGVGIRVMEDVFLPFDSQLSVFFVAEAIRAMYRDLEFIADSLEFPIQKLV
jgi:hypothetical protein